MTKEIEMLKMFLRLIVCLFLTGDTENQREYW